MTDQQAQTADQIHVGDLVRPLSDGEVGVLGRIIRWTELRGIVTSVYTCGHERRVVVRWDPRSYGRTQSRGAQYPSGIPAEWVTRA